MVASKDFSTIVNVQIEQHVEHKTFALTSSDLPGFFLAGKELAPLLSDVPSAIALLYKFNYGMDVTVVPAQEGGPAEHADGGWLKVPQQFVALPLAGQLS